MSPVLQILQTYVNMYVYILRQSIFGPSEKNDTTVQILSFKILH